MPNEGQRTITSSMSSHSALMAAADRGRHYWPVIGHGNKMRERPPSPWKMVRRDGTRSVLVAGSLSVPRFRAYRGRASGDLQADTGSGCEAMSECLEPNLDDPVGLLRLEPGEPIAHVGRESLGTHFTQPDEQIGVGIVSPVDQLDDRNPDHFERLTEHRRGEGQHIVPRLELTVVAIASCGRIDYSAAY